MAERLTGIQVHEEAGSEQAIAETPTAITAFVGRCLRGPVNRPVDLTCFAEFQRIFGGLWQPSTLSYAVEQYFENGGRAAIVVRVANGARCCTLTLAAGEGALVLQALSPGTREFLRAAVDYDGIGDNEDDRFNLVLQRVRTPGSEHIEDQEIYRRLTVLPDQARHVAAALADSPLARVAGAVPLRRPDPTPRSDPRGIAGYVASEPGRDDGGALTDYDVIGSAARGTGLFALDGRRPIQLSLHSAAGARRGRRREHAARREPLLSRASRDTVRRPAAWPGTRQARRLPKCATGRCLAIPPACIFPRLLAFDKLRGRFEAFAPSGAVAGTLSRAADVAPVWSASGGDETALRPGLRPSCAVDDDYRARLLASGVNTVQTVRRPGRDTPIACTLAGPGARAVDWRWLPARRLALMIIDSIERGTRWMVFEPNEPPTWRRAAAQVRSFLASLEDRGAFAHREPGDRWFVLCDERVNREQHRERGIVNLMFGFAASRSGEFHAYMVSHRAGGSRTQAVSPNLAGLPGTGITQVLEELELPADSGLVQALP